MRILKRREYHVLAILASAISLILCYIMISMALIESDAHIAPDYPKINIIPILSQKQFREEDYLTLFYQTGLGKPAIDELRESLSDSTQRILHFQESFFSNVDYICEKNSPISWEESVIDDGGRYINGTELASLHNGYILITKSSHTFGWRNGHTAIIIDAARGITLESVVLGTDSCFQSIDKWTNYPNFMLLRLKGVSLELLNEIALSAYENLNKIPYDFKVGILSPKFSKAGEISGTHCSHLIWEAFRLFDYDLDSDKGLIVTPKDIANSPYLEVVQVFGVNPKAIWP